MVKKKKEKFKINDKVSFIDKDLLLYRCRVLGIKENSLELVCRKRKIGSGREVKKITINENEVFVVNEFEDDYTP